jgi:hypothetical protein
VPLSDRFITASTTRRCEAARRQVTPFDEQDVAGARADRVRRRRRIVYCSVPWAPALLALAALIIVAALKSKQTTMQVVLANLAAVFVALAVFEGYLGYRDSVGDETVMEGTITEGFTHADDVLGYAPDKGSRVTARKRYRRHYPVRRRVYNRSRWIADYATGEGDRDRRVRLLFSVIR